MSATFLYQRHIDLGAKMTNFSGWHMPLRYSSQTQEHQAVRQSCGLFDVSHMLTVDITGVDALSFMRRIYSNDVTTSVDSGTALYGCMLNEQGFVIDDLICYVINEQHYRIVINAGRRDVDMAWLEKQSLGMSLTITSQPHAGIIALQGPKALATVSECYPLLAKAQTLRRMQGQFYIEPLSADSPEGLFVARSGYTGEDGVEIIGSQQHISDCWDSLIAAGVQPCGLGARDSLRLEAGLCLYGHELSESISPLEAGIGWAVNWSHPERAFIGKEKLLLEKEAGSQRKLVGLVLLEKGIMRAEQEVLPVDASRTVGHITSGGFSPVLNTSIALALLDAPVTESECLISIRGKQQKAIITKAAFVRNGKPLININ